NSTIRAAQQIVFLVSVVLGAASVSLLSWSSVNPALGYWLLGASVLGLGAVYLLKPRWVIQHAGRRIGFESSCYAGESLLFDDVRVARGAAGVMSELQGVLHGSADGAELIRVLTESSFTKVRCRILASPAPPESVRPLAPKALPNALSLRVFLVI